MADPFMSGMTVVVLFVCPPNYTNLDMECKRYEFQYSADTAQDPEHSMTLLGCMTGQGIQAVNKWLETHPHAVNRPRRWKCLTGRQAVADRSF